MDINSEAVNWLFEKENPSIRYRTLTELLDRPPDDAEVIEAFNEIPDSKPVLKILSKMHPDGYWLVLNKSKGESIGDGVEYSDFNTTHFCLAYLSELGLTGDNPQVQKATDRYLDLQRDDGDFLRHFSCLYTYNIRTFIRLGFKDDPRVRKTIELLLSTERPDGGYLCDMHEGKYKTKPVKSCIRGTVKALLAFSELPEYHEHPRCKELVQYFLNRDCLFRSNDLTTPVNGGMVTTRFPITWRTSLTEILYAISKMGYGDNEHVKRAWALLDTKKDDPGRYVLDWTPSQVQKLFKIGKRGEANKWVTLYALLALKYRKETGQ
ncbi:MAG: hypothetical protein JW712_10685 [Dehalococcoidales bacterium]|nr:hypothetical protein [Dehalococcoidales bacterium]